MISPVFKINVQNESRCQRSSEITIKIAFDVSDMNVWAAERFGRNISIVPDDVAHTGILLSEVWIKEITKSMD